MMERKQELMRQRRDAGPVSAVYPEVSSIVMNMTYNQKGARSILRTFCYSPDSYAFFVVNCLNKECVDGGFDLTHVVNEMIKNRRAEARGTICCEGTDPSDNHSDIAYEVAVEYS